MGADPFAKVKSMIKGMLTKLNEKQAQDSKQGAFCDEEMGKTTKSQKRKGEDVQKMKDRIASLTADLTQTKADIATATKDMADITSATGEAKTIRVRSQARENVD